MSYHLSDMKIKGVTKKASRRYACVKDRVDDCVDRIYAHAKMLELAYELDPLDNAIDPLAVGMFGKLIAKDVCRIVSCLDEFANPIDHKQ